MRFLVVFRSVIFVSHFFLNGGDFLFAFLRKKEDVHFEESFSQSLLEFVCLIVFVALELLYKVTLHESCNLSS